MNHILEIDVANAVSGVGNNAAAVAWNGTDLWVAGFNGGVNVQSVAINKLSNALSPTATWGTPFGVQATTPVNRGYMNLDVDPANGRLIAGYDNGAADPLGLTCWDLNGNLLWSKNMRGGAGLGFDPGFRGGNPAAGSGVAWGAFGQPGRALQDAANGNDIWTVANGMTVLVGGQGTFLRDWDFEDATGDIYIRASNNVFVGRRLGDNLTATTLLVDGVEANFVNLQNVAVLDTPNATAILYNDRQTAATNQFWELVILATRLDGLPETIDWNGFQTTVTPSAAAYDFSYHRASNTVAIVDYLRRKVDIFAVTVPTWVSFGAGCPGQGGIVPGLTASGTLTPAGGAVTYTVANTAPASIGLIAFGFVPGSIPLNPPCFILVDPLLTFYLGPYVTGPGAPGSGSFSGTLNVPPGYGGNTVSTQGAILEAFVVSNIVTTNGLFMRIP
jgi:hypothetical protein